MKLSVIIPVYNVQDYLAQCMNAVIGQTYTDLEIILVNDGSTDCSPEICGDFRKKDARIKVIHQQNGGVSSARNTGTAAASGDYITFVDSDDWLEKDMYKKLVYAACNNQEPDVVMGDYITVRDYDTTKITSGLREGFYSKKDIIREVYPSLLVTENFGRLPIVSACICIFNKNFILNNDIHFDESLRYSEDYLFMAAVMNHCESYFYVKNYFGYYYRQYATSRSKKYEPEWWSNLLDLNKKSSKLLSDNKEYDFTRQLKLQLIHSALFVTNSIYTHKGMTKAQKRGLLKKVFNESELISAFSNLHFDKQSLSLKIVIYLMKYRLAGIYLSYRDVVSIIKQ